MVTRRIFPKLNKSNTINSTEKNICFAVQIIPFGWVLCTLKLKGGKKLN